MVEKDLLAQYPCGIFNKACRREFNNTTENCVNFGKKKAHDMSPFKDSAGIMSLIPIFPGFFLYFKV